MTTKSQEVTLLHHLKGQHRRAQGWEFTAKRADFGNSDNHVFYHYHSEKTAWWESLAEAAEGQKNPLGKIRMNRAEYNPRNTGEAKFS